MVGQRASMQRHPHGRAVQGGSLNTWSQAYPSPHPNELVLGTDGRPLDANVEVWQGPGNTPRRMRVYSEDGMMRPFRSTEPPRGQPNTIALRNEGPLEFPMNARVAAGMTPRGVGNAMGTVTGGAAMGGISPGVTIQGGATKSFPIDASVDSVHLFLQTQGRNLEAKVEVLQGPDCVRQVIDLSEDYGYDRPFSCILDTPGYGSVIRIINTGPMTFPFTVSVTPHSFSQGGYGYDDRYAQVGGGSRPALGNSYDPYGAASRGNWAGQTSLGGYQGGNAYGRGGGYRGAGYTYSRWRW